MACTSRGNKACLHSNGHITVGEMEQIPRTRLVMPHSSSMLLDTRPPLVLGPMFTLTDVTEQIDNTVAKNVDQQEICGHLLSLSPNL